MAGADATIHASAVLAGTTAVLIRGPSGAGKSRLAMALIEAAACGEMPFSRLVGDDRVTVEAVSGRLLVRPTPALAGLIEVRGVGIRQLDFEPVAVVALVVDLAAPDAGRLPDAQAESCVISGITLPRLALPGGADPYPAVKARLGTVPAVD